MVDTYKGESPNKKFARYWFWHLVADRLGAAFYAGRHAFLASRVGGDVSVLRAMGVHDEQMLAVERDVDAARQFKTLWPTVPIAVGDASKVIPIENSKAPLTSVFLDFCAPLCSETVECATRVASVLSVGSVLGVGTLKGREQSRANLKLGSDLLVRNRHQRRFFASITRGSVGKLGSSHAVAFRASVGTVSAGELAADAPNRAAALQLLICSRRTGALVALLRVIHYQSSTPSSRGVPITIGIFGKGVKPPKDYPSWRFTEWTEDSIRNAVLSDELGARTAGLLNIPAGTAAAWRAHATRGTYATQEKETGT